MTAEQDELPPAWAAAMAAAGDELLQEVSQLEEMPQVEPMTGRSLFDRAVLSLLLPMLSLPSLPYILCIILRGPVASLASRCLVRISSAVRDPARCGAVISFICPSVSVLSMRHISLLGLALCSRAHSLPSSPVLS